MKRVIVAESFQDEVDDGLWHELHDNLLTIMLSAT